MAKKGKSSKPHHRYYENNPSVPKLAWLDLLGRNATSSDGRSLGKVEAINADIVVLKKGMTQVVRYWVPVEILKDIRVGAGGKLQFTLTHTQMQHYKKDLIPNPANFAALGASTSYMAYPPIPYLPDEMLKEKYRQKPEDSEK